MFANPVKANFSIYTAIGLLFKSQIQISLLPSWKTCVTLQEIQAPKINTIGIILYVRIISFLHPNNRYRTVGISTAVIDTMAPSPHPYTIIMYTSMRCLRCN